MNPMNALVSEGEFDALLSASLAIVFKHSTLCSVSARAHREAEAFLRSHPEHEIHVVHVIEERGVSDHIATVTGVRHQSPQILVLRKGEVVWHVSHFDVTAEAVASAVS
jgi:monothiol bacilliredoxin